MDRIQQGQAGTLNASWEHDGFEWDPGPGVTVSIARDDGTSLVTNAATSGSDLSGRTYSLTPAQTSLLDRLTATWTASDGSTLTTYAEIVGGFHFSVARARSRSPLGDTVAYPTRSLIAYRTMAEMALEDICGVSFAPRYSHDEANIATYGLLELPRRRIRKVRAIYTATNAGPQALSTLSGLRIMHGSSLFMPILWTYWSLPITVGYEHGYDEIPPRVARASLELCRRWIVESPWDERMTAFRTRDGGQLSILTASHSDPFDLPEVVAVADQYGLPMIA